MAHICIKFELVDTSVTELIMANLINIGFEGFEESGTGLIAYIDKEEYNSDAVTLIAEQYNLQYDTTTIEPQNWNAQWEENFQPVVIEGFCTVRAHFHTLETKTPYEIRITPKMSFGTGHHATTQLMMMQMRDIDLNGKHVLDFGTGTGILAILAEQLGASSVLAIDNDEWSYENAKENIGQNDCQHITVKQDTLQDDGVQYDIILANINRHILLNNMELLYVHTVAGGTIIMSGLLHADQDIIVDEAVRAGLVLRSVEKLGDWLLLLFNKL